MLTLIASALALAIVGCGVPPELEPQPGVPVPSPSTVPTTGRPVIPLPLPSATTPGAEATFAENYAVACLGRPSGDQVIAMLRATTKLLPRTGTIAVPTGPLCAGNWQYTILTVTGKDPLQVVTQGAPKAMKLVTAGTNVCSVDVRTHAPVGIIAAARC